MMCWQTLGLVVLIAGTSSLWSVSAPGDEPALIPMSVEQVHNLLAPFKRSPKVRFLPPSPYDRCTVDGHLLYSFKASDGTDFEMDAMTGDLEIIDYEPERASPEEV